MSKTLVALYQRSYRVKMSSNQFKTFNPSSKKDSVSISTSISPSVSSGHINFSSPIGFIRSCFKSKNGTPRQPTVCSFSRAKLQILKSVFVCPAHSLDGLSQFSHVWILFVFHQNSQESFTKAKVKPPRLDGRKVGVFASRSPHRPNPIGLTLARLDKVDGDTLYLSGMDMIDGTPVLDVKPYVPEYDALQGREANRAPPTSVSSEDDDCHIDSVVDSTSCAANVDKGCRLDAGTILGSGDGAVRDCLKTCVEYKQSQWQVESLGSHGVVISERGDHHKTDTDGRCGEVTCDEVRIADWISTPPIERLTVRFTQSAEAQLASFWLELATDSADYQLEFLHDYDEAHKAIVEILSADPRSVYRRNECSDRLYYFTIDGIHVTSWFGPGFVEVLYIQPVSHASIPDSKGIKTFPNQN